MKTGEILANTIIATMAITGFIFYATAGAIYLSVDLPKGSYQADYPSWYIDQQRAKLDQLADQINFYISLAIITWLTTIPVGFILHRKGVFDRPRYLCPECGTEQDATNPKQVWNNHGWIELRCGHRVEIVKCPAAANHGAKRGSLHAQTASATP